MVEGAGSKTFDTARAFCLQQPALADRLLQMLTDTTIAYLRGQIAAGADCVQIFDSWGGLLGPSDFARWSQPHLNRITAALRALCPVIVFAKGAWYALESLSTSGAAALGLDWCIDARTARALAGPHITLQGNLDPVHLLGPIPDIQRETRAMLTAFGAQRYVVNLGHGILPNTPVDHARAFVDTVKSA
jgi:uroporphyrinogen decarboxylase